MPQPLPTLTDEEIAKAGELGLGDYQFDPQEIAGLNQEPVGPSFINSGAGKKTVEEIKQAIGQRDLSTLPKEEIEKAFRAGGFNGASPEQTKTNIPKEGAVVSEESARAMLGTDFTGAIKNADGTFTLSPEALLRSGKATAEKTPDQIAQENIQKQYEQGLKEMSSILDPLKRQLEANKIDQIDSIKRQYVQLREAQEEANERRVRLEETIGVRFGGARYAPEHTADLVQEQIDIGLQKIQDLNSEEQQAISKIQGAFDEKSYTIALKEYEGLKELRKARTDEIDKLQKATAEALKEKKKDIAETEKAFYERVTKPINDVLISAGEQGAPTEVLMAIQKCGNIMCAVSSAGEYATKIGSGIVGEYNFYKKEATSLGQKPLTFDEYQTRDANRKIAMNKTISGLPSNISTQVDKLSASFDSSPIVKQFNEVQNKTATIYSIVDSGVPGGPSDLALVFEFMKSLDPTSVVREAEYDTASKASNPFKRIAAKMGGYISDGQILPQEVRDEFKRLSDVKLGIITKQYENLRNETGRQIEIKTKEFENTPGVDYLKNYAQAITLGDEIIQDESDAEVKVRQIYTAHQDEIDKLITAKPDITYSEILQVLGQ